MKSASILTIFFKKPTHLTKKAGFTAWGVTQFITGALSGLWYLAHDLMVYAIRVGSGLLSYTAYHLTLSHHFQASPALCCYQGQLENVN